MAPTQESPNPLKEFILGLGETLLTVLAVISLAAPYGVIALWDKFINHEPKHQ